MRARRLRVDELIDRGLSESPATDWSLTLPKDWLNSLPIETDVLVRPVDTRRSGYLRSPVYRGLEVVPQPLVLPLLVLSDVAGLRASLYMNADTGVIGYSLDDVGLDTG